MASGQLASSQGTIEAARSGQQHPVTVSLYNTDSGNETVTVQFVSGSGADSGNARTIYSTTLGPGESAILSNLPLGPADLLQAAATTGAKVNYVTFPGVQGGPLTFRTFDANGALKTITASSLGAVTNPAINFKNVIDGGDFTVNPFQRGTSQAADITSTLTYGPDRFFFKGGGSSAINWSQVADTSIAGFANALKMQRKAANTDVVALAMGQVVETADAIRLQGQQVTLSFWAKAGANYSGGSLTVAVHSGTGSNQSAANMLAGSWTGYTAPISSTQAITATMARYSFTGTIPTGCTQAGFSVTWTPAGTAGADDSITFQGFQLELGSSASAFEHRDIEVELALCQRYYFRINEPASNVIVGAGQVAGTNAEIIFIPLPVQMRAAPTVTVSAGSFKFNVAGTPTSVAGFAAGSTHTPNYISVVGTTTATSGQATLLQGGGGAGFIDASAEF